MATVQSKLEITRFNVTEVNDIGSSSVSAIIHGAAENKSDHYIDGKSSIMKHSNDSKGIMRELIKAREKKNMNRK